MLGWFIAAFGGGLVLIFAAMFVFPRFCRRAYASAPDRFLIETKIRARYGCRVSIVAQVLVAVAFVFWFVHARDTSALTCIYLFALLLCVAFRSMFREMSIAAETELEMRSRKKAEV